MVDQFSGSRLHVLANHRRVAGPGPGSSDLMPGDQEVKRRRMPSARREGVGFGSCGIHGLERPWRVAGVACLPEVIAWVASACEEFRRQSRDFGRS